MKFNLDIPKMGDTILVKGTDKFFSRGIRLKQLQSGFSQEDAQYTHVEISGGGHRSMKIAPPKASRIDITKVYNGVYIKIRRPILLDWDRRRKHVAWVNATLCNTAYDGTGIVRFLLKWFKQSTSRWFCSEGWLFSIQEEYPKFMWKLKPEDCMPAHAASTEEMETVWEGIIE